MDLSSITTIAAEGHWRLRLALASFVLMAATGCGGSDQQTASAISTTAPTSTTTTAETTSAPAPTTSTTVSTSTTTEAPTCGLMGEQEFESIWLVPGTLEQADPHRCLYSTSDGWKIELVVYEASDHRTQYETARDQIDADINNLTLPEPAQQAFFAREQARMIAGVTAADRSAVVAIDQDDFDPFRFQFETATVAANLAGGDLALNDATRFNRWANLYGVAAVEWGSGIRNMLAALEPFTPNLTGQLEQTALRGSVAAQENLLPPLEMVRGLAPRLTVGADEAELLDTEVELSIATLASLKECSSQDECAGLIAELAVISDDLFAALDTIAQVQQGLREQGGD